MPKCRLIEIFWANEKDHVFLNNLEAKKLDKLCTKIIWVFKEVKSLVFDFVNLFKASI